MTTFTIYRNAINNLATEYDAIKEAAIRRKFAEKYQHTDLDRFAALETEAVNRASLTLRTYTNLFGDPIAIRIGHAAERICWD